MPRSARKFGRLLRILPLSCADSLRPSLSSSLPLESSVLSVHFSYYLVPQRPGIHFGVASPPAIRISERAIFSPPESPWIDSIKLSWGAERLLVFSRRENPPSLFPLKGTLATPLNPPFRSAKLSEIKKILITEVFECEKDSWKLRRKFSLRRCCSKQKSCEENIGVQFTKLMSYHNWLTWVIKEFLYLHISFRYFFTYNLCVHGSLRYFV